MTDESLSQGYTPNTPPSISNGDISTAAKPSDISDKFDAKDDWDETLRRMHLPAVQSVKGSCNYFIIDGKLVTPDTIFSLKDELEGKQRMLAVKYLWAVRGLICPGNAEKGNPPHGLSLKRKDGELTPACDIHHLVKYLDAAGRKKRLHMAKFMRLVCHDHNAEYKEPVIYPLDVIKSLGGVPVGLQGSPQAPVSVSSRPELAPGAREESSKDQTARHNWERPAWDEWIADDAWKQLRKAGLLSESGWVLRKDLADFAVHALEDPIEGKGSRVTFERYIDEDRFSVLELVKEKGRWYVRRRTEDVALGLKVAAAEESK